MNTVNAILLGSAACLGTIPIAQAADLPAKKAAQIEYVRVCSTHGQGFFYIPGTDTCIRIGGRARFEYHYTGPLVRNVQDWSGYRGLGRLQVDARTSTSFGTLRTFVRFEIASRTGVTPLRSASAERRAQAFYATGVDTFGRAQKYVEVDKAFIQFAGMTAGVYSSFFDFYGSALEFIGGTAGSNVPSTTGIAYTHNFGGGYSATLSVEDPMMRRNPVYYTASGYANQAPGAVVPTALTNLSYSGAIFQAPIGLTFNPATGLPTSYASIDVAQRSQMPDAVANLRYDGGWGSAQLSGAIHQISIGQFVSTTTPAATITSAGTIGAPTTGPYTGFANTSTFASGNGFSGKRPDAAYGYAVQAGVKFNLTMLAPGDQLYLQAAWGHGALSYSGAASLLGADVQTAGARGGFSVNMNEAYIDAYGKLNLSNSWTIVGALLHYWTPTVRQAVFASLSGVSFGNRARSSIGPGYQGLGGTLVPTNGIFTAQQAINYANSPLLKSWDLLYLGTNLIWSPVKDLDLGIELGYARLDPDGRVADLNKAVSYSVGGLSYPKTVGYEDVVVGRIRVQRDF